MVLMLSMRTIFIQYNSKMYYKRNWRTVICTTVRYIKLFFPFREEGELKRNHGYEFWSSYFSINMSTQIYEIKYCFFIQPNHLPDPSLLNSYPMLHNVTVLISLNLKSRQSFYCRILTLSKFAYSIVVAQTHPQSDQITNPLKQCKTVTM